MSIYRERQQLVRVIADLTKECNEKDKDNLRLLRNCDRYIEILKGKDKELEAKNKVIGQIESSINRFVRCRERHSKSEYDFNSLTNELLGLLPKDNKQ